VIDLPRPPLLAALLSAAEAPQIVLAALTRLRWLAVVGQVGACAVASAGLHLQVPVAPIASVIGVTALSNVLLIAWGRFAPPSIWLVRATILLDVLLLTALLYLTGGPANPFAALYLVHVAMAVIVGGMAWTWVVVAAAAACYGLLLSWNLPLRPAPGKAPPAGWVGAVGSWAALVLVSVLIAVFIGRVIRALRQRELELAAARERAAKNEQLAALTTLAAGAAHELNTPLGTIAVVAKELELSCGGQEDATDAAGTGGPLSAVLDDARLIRREVDRCRAILGRLRLDVEDAAPPRGVVRVDELVANLRDSLQEPEASRLEVRRSADVESVNAPARALEQALLVLVRNAFDASPPDRPVTLEVSRRRDGRVRFDVRDRGSGMSEQVLRRAGEPFFTTKGPGRGMGLGLFLVHLVAERCGATFSLDSREGEGTHCVLEIPDARPR
jgi:two-component system sensor histidine kinase RegB